MCVLGITIWTRVHARTHTHAYFLALINNVHVYNTTSCIRRHTQRAPPTPCSNKLYLIIFKDHYSSATSSHSSKPLPWMYPLPGSAHNGTQTNAFKKFLMDAWPEPIKEKILPCQAMGFSRGMLVHCAGIVVALFFIYFSFLILGYPPGGGGAIVAYYNIYPPCLFI